MNPPAVLETPRLLLRPFTLDNLDDYYRIGTCVEAMRYRGLGEPFKSVDEAREMLERAPLRDYRVRGFGRLACIEKASGRFVGWNGLKYLEDLDEVDIGYRFFPESWGQGFATESGLAVMEHGRSTLALERIIGLVDRDNRASSRVLQKLGLRFERVIELTDVGELDLYS